MLNIKYRIKLKYYKNGAVTYNPEYRYWFWPFYCRFYTTSIFGNLNYVSFSSKEGAMNKIKEDIEYRDKVKNRKKIIKVETQEVIKCTTKKK